MEVFPFDLIPCIQKGRQSEAFYMNYIDQKCNGENTSLEFSPARIFLLHRPLSCALCKFFGTEELFLDVLINKCIIIEIVGVLTSIYYNNPEITTLPTSSYRECLFLK